MNGHKANITAKPKLNYRVGLLGTLLLTSLFTLGACGGGAGTEQLPQQSNQSNSTSVDIYNGTPERDDQVRAFKTTVYDGLRLTERCGGCHTSTSNTSQAPYFMQRDDVNVAYDTAMGNLGGAVLINTTDPASSRLVTKMANDPKPEGHHCWLETKEACAFFITNRIQNMVSVAQGNNSREIPLTAPQDHEIEVFRAWPDTPPAQFATLHNILRTNCATCHVPNAATQGSPLFAVADMTTAYNELRVNGKVVLGDTVESRAQSRIVVRPRDEDHVCWDTDNDGDVDCPESAQAILDAINLFVGAIPDPNAGGNNILTNLVTSKALTMADALLASGGNRYEANQIALYEFKTGAGRDIVDVSASSPGVDLRLLGTEGVDYRWLGNFGVEFLGPNGKAVANPATVDKFYREIAPTGEYSIEAWVVPNNVVQENAAIVSYASGSDNRNFGLEQNMYNYTFYNRLTVSGAVTATGEPAIQTPDDPETAQAALQHVVITYNTSGGRKIYVNGRLNGATESEADGNLSDWNPNYQFILGNSDANDKPWRGAIRLVAVHNRELTPAQIRQNFDVGVGEKFYMLFPLREKDPDTTDNVTTEPPLAGVPASCHVKFEFMQYDGFSYLFTNPDLICLDSADSPAGIQVKGMWLGINGSFPNAGQAYQNLNVNDPADGTTTVAVNTATNSVTLSNVGTIIELKNGPLGTSTLAPDQFFLGFDIIGAADTVDTYLPDPAASLPPPAAPADPAPSSDIGLRTFDEINLSMSAMTGIAPTNTAIRNVFNQYIQQLPGVEAIDAFLPAHQMAVAQLALQYCNQMVLADIGTGNASNGLFTGSFNDYDTTLSSAALRTEVVDKFMQMFMNYDTTATTPALLTQPDIADVRSYLTDSGSITFSDNRPWSASTNFNSLMQTLVSRGTSTDKVVTATCGAVLGSAVTLVQ